MAKGQKRSTREKKKPKQDKNKTKAPAPASPFASVHVQGTPIRGYGGRKT